MQPQTPQLPGEQQNGGFYEPAQNSGYERPTPDGGDYAPPTNNIITWEASEYVHRAKDPIWIVIFSIVVVGAIGVAVWTQIWTLVGLVVAMAIAAAMYAFRKPRNVRYRISAEGVTINDKTYPFSNFKSFGVKGEDAFFTLYLMPAKRFMPAMTMYFAEDNGEQIVDVMGAHLPIEEIGSDPVDNFMRRIHF